MRLTFWQPFASFHQEGLFQALSRADWVESLGLKVESGLPAARRAAGWREADLPGVSVSRICAEERPENDPDQVHIFTGFHTHSLIWRAFDRLPVRHACRCFAYAEAPDPRGAIGRARRCKYRLASRKIAPRLEGLLVTGPASAAFYRNILTRDLPLHLFGYYDGTQPPAAPPPRAVSSIPRLLVAGQLIHRKGIDLLLTALADLRDLSWELRLIGSGPQQDRLQRLAGKAGIAGRIQWLGRRDHAEVQAELRAADLLLLPSRWDGWGMTVNEALRAGCPVRASANCGAAGILPSPWVLPMNTAAWPALLRNAITAGRSPQEETLARTHAEETLGTSGAERLNSILAV